MPESPSGSSADRPTDSDAAAASAESVLRRLERKRAEDERYEVRDEIAHGGMGRVLEAWEEDLRRTVAMKTLLARDDGPDRARLLERFLDEAQVTAQLDHPGVVPVHELGLDHTGQVYFTMARVRGEDLSDVFERVWSGEEGWTRTRLLGVLQRVCETVAFAHERGIIHRDLKPANVMVGSFGEVYVMDWGLAKVLDADDPPPVESRVTTDRTEGGSGTGPLTLEGAVVGTPAFMAPEQAHGHRLDARADVYAVGTLLYTLLAGHEPYGDGVPYDAVGTLLALRTRPPKPLKDVASDVPPELVAICERAMERDPDSRYPTMVAMAEDLRAFLEQRVVSAYRTGAWAEFQKWVARNKGMAATGLGLLLAVVGGLGGVGYVQAEGKRAVANQLEKVLRLSDVKEIRALLDEEPGLYPPVPRRLEDHRNWLRRAEEILGRRPDYEAARDELLAAVQQLEGDGLESVRLADRIRRNGWQLDIVDELLEGIEQAEALLSSVRERAEWAADLERRTVSGEDARARWSTCVQAVAASPHYPGLDLEPQIGLLPLGADPDSGLWEFWHVRSGAEPERGEDGRWRHSAQYGIVLVLIPPGTLITGTRPLTEVERTQFDWRGKSPQEITELFADLPPSVDPESALDERPLDEVTLDAYFVGKFEVTRAQWERTMGPPSEASVGADFPGNHPIESVTREGCLEFARRLDLELPTEAQWERMARANTRSVFSSGNASLTLQGFANLADKTYSLRGGEHRASTALEDGHLYHAPVGSFEPNGFGIHDVHGNVWEWCRDDWHPRNEGQRSGDGLREGASDTRGVIRGGSWNTPSSSARIGNRMGYLGKDKDLGVRVARRLDP